MVQTQLNAVSGDSFSLFICGCFDCNIAHRPSVAVLCVLYKTRLNPMHPLYGTLPEPCVTVRVTLGTLVTHRYTYEPPRCRTSLRCRTFVSFSVSLWNDLAVSPFDFDGLGLAGFMSRANSLLLA